MLKVQKVFLIFGALAASSPAADAQVLKILEAEKCKITCASKAPRNEASEFCSNNARTPNEWGRAEGDSISWEENFDIEAPLLRLGVRYAFDRDELQGRRRIQNAPLNLKLTIDETSISVPLKNTVGWDRYITEVVDLPALSKGLHKFQIAAAENGSDRNIDCVFFFHGKTSEVPVQLLQTVIAKSENGKFQIWTSPDTKLPYTTTYIFDNVSRIYDFLKDQTDFEPNVKTIGIHIRPDRYVGGRQFQNGRGIWFSDAPGSCQPGGWCHEMNHFYTPHIPSWFGHPILRVNDTFITIPKLFPEYPDYNANGGPGARDRRMAAEKFLRGNPFKVSDPHVIANALYLKYGDQLLSKFYHAVSADLKSGKLILKDNVLSPTQLVQYMSLAAGEDVTPVFNRLEGFPKHVETKYQGI